MGRLIDADALIPLIKMGECNMYDEYCQGRNGGIEFAINRVNQMPTIEERKTGMWVKVHGYCTPGGDPVWCCSECGKGVHVYGIEHGTYGADISDGQWKACPNCSALMEGEQP